MPARRHNRLLALALALAVGLVARREAVGGAESPSTGEVRRVGLPPMTALTVVAQFAVVGAARASDEWHEEEHAFADGFRESPQWDDDSAWFNLVLHPWVGSEYYLLARNRAWSRSGCLLYSAALSTFYEYVPENLIQQPSAIDLCVTPLAGSLLGELRYVWKERWRGRAGRSARACRWAGLIDPVDVTVGGYPDGEMRLLFRCRAGF